MKKTLTLFTFLGAFASQSQAQIPTFSDDIAQLIYDNCASCHHQGGLGPFPLITYMDVVSESVLIQEHVNDGHMPPWPPNSDYQSYAHDRSLTDTEKALINDWINGGMPIGDTSAIPAPPVFNQGSILGTPDLQLTIPVYRSKATGSQDDYVCFSLPTGLTNNRILRAIEVVPGNTSIVHHALVFKDNAGTYATDTAGFCTGPTNDMIAGYAPGEVPLVYPNGGTVKMGTTLSAGGNIVLAMHYPSGSGGEYDSTSVNLFFYDEAVTNVREVTSQSLLQEWGFCISPNTIDTVNSVFPPSFGTPGNYSLLSVFPHAHLLGKEFLIYAVTSVGDTIPLIHVPEWDFHWQGFYTFKNVIKLPAGSRLYGHISYDNTSANPNNPNDPPQQVCAGLNTADEMFLVYFQFLPYQAGDENIDLEALTAFPTSTEALPETQTLLKVYPNPFKQQTNFEYELKTAEKVELSIYNLQGQLVQQIVNAEQGAGIHQISWNGASAQGNELPSGMYVAQLRMGAEVHTKKISRF